MNRKTRRSRRIVAKLILGLIGFLLGAIVSEIALRAVGYSYPEFYTTDPVRGYALRPGAEGWYRKEGEAYVRINSAGLRDREHSTTKPPNTVRIAVLGDSYPEALSVSEQKAFWSVMGERLNECGVFAGKKVEVLNFGVSGYGTAQELLTLREQVWKYSPDLVMLAVTTNNDIADNSRALKKTDEIPYFVYKDNRLILDDSFRSSPAFLGRQNAISGLGRWLRSYSRLVQAIVEGHHALKVRAASWRKAETPKASSPNAPPTAPEEPAPARQRPDQLSRADELGVDNLVYLEPGDATWNEAWRVTEELIMTMRDEVETRGALFVVVTLSNGIQVVPNRDVREAFEQRLGIADIFYPDNRIKGAGAREGIRVITLAPELQELAAGSNTYLHGFGDNIGNGHWNSAGHQAAGELLAKKLCHEVLPK